MQLERGYVEVKTPQLYDSPLFETSGHWGKYKENLFVSAYEEREFALKPMNCPGHCHLFGLQRWSYRDLPYRCAEPGLLHRREPSGTLHGLLRVRHFCQDDAHIFCREDQIQDEVAGCLEFALRLYGLFGLEVQLRALDPPRRPHRRATSSGTRPRGCSRRRCAPAATSTRINEGDGAFYAPKIDLHMTDSLGRSWQLGTVQLDYNLPERFGLTYTGADNAEHMPVMIHRALFGSFERFIGILLEQTAGELPVWLAPVQAIALPIADRHVDAARAAADRLADAGVRVELDERTESVGRKIRDAELQKIPYMLVVGDKRGRRPAAVALRRHGEGDQGTLPVDELADGSWPSRRCSLAGFALDLR